jgi:intracellular sulfur oxidation DsrE/DsrF family protein
MSSSHTMQQEIPLMFSVNDASTPRRGFLGRVALAAAALGLSGSAPAVLAAERAPRLAGGADPELDAWFGKLTGKHRQVFDAPYPNEGMPGVWPRVYLLTTEGTYPGESTTAMAILRHHAIPLAMQDSLWAKYKLGEMFGIKNGDAPATANPYATITGLPLPGLGIAELVKSGVLIGCCGAAIGVYSAAAAKKMNMDANTVKQEWIAGLFPGVQVVPSGVMAVGRAQELGCSYCYAG